LSVQSVATFASDATSILEQPAEHEDSIMTTTSVMTAGGTKRGRAKKATTAKGKKTRGKKDEPVEVLEDPPEEELPPPPPPKPTRGRKRTSDAVEDPALANAEAPATKKRATRVRRSNTVDTTVIEPEQDQEMVDTVPAPAAKAARKKSSASSVRNNRKVSTASTASTASLRYASNDVLDDEELDRQLQADLDRPLTDDEMIVGDSDSERKKAPAKGKGKKAAAKKTAQPTQELPTDDHAMFDPSPVEIDDADVSAELKELREKMEVEEAESLQVPKKGRKAGLRKASKQTKAQKAQEKDAEIQPETQPEAESVADVEDALATVEPSDEHDASIASNATVLKNSTMSTAAPKKRGRPKKISTQSQSQPDVVEAHPEPPRKPVHADLTESVHKSSTSSTSRAAVAAMQPKHRALPPPPATEDELQAPSTPRAAKPSASVTKQPAPSPSQSPQSSDAENQPPSSKPSNTASSTRVALAPVAATPIKASPSKRNVNFLSGLQSNQPWTAVDLDFVFEELGKENVMLAPALPTGVQLTSPEKKMTVEEWIYHNACLAEQRLKGQCEATVSKFESEGGRAMRVLEELVVD
jgi:hypothetical protein